MKKGMRKGVLALALMLAVGMTAAPVQAATADLAPGEAQEVTFQQKSKITLKHTKGKNAADVKVIQRILEKNSSYGTDISKYTDLNNRNHYRWTKKEG